MVKVKCKFCGYVWDYKGNSELFISCPKCLKKLRIEDVIINEEVTSEVVEEALKMRENFDEFLKKYNLSLFEFKILLKSYIKALEKIFKKTGENGIELGNAIRLLRWLENVEKNRN